MIEAFHLPAVPDPPTTAREFGEGPDAVGLLLPALTATLLRDQIDALLIARDRHLAERPVAEIVSVVDRVARRFMDRADPLRRTAESALPGISGLSAPMVRCVLDGMAAGWCAEPLRALLDAEFGDPAVLDEFRPRAGGQSRAFGPRLTAHIFSGNVPGVAVTAVVRSLLLKSATLGKSAAGEPLLPALFARSLAEEDAALGECLAIAYWPGGESTLEQVAFERAEAVVVYGGAEAVAGVRARTPPAARFIGYGHRLSFGIIGREALTGGNAVESARAAARDAVLFDQQGCVSPHLFYVEAGGEIAPNEWAALLAHGMEELEAELPRGRILPGEASTIHQVRGEAEFAQLGGVPGMELHVSSRGTAWTVIFDPDPVFTPSCLNRTVRVKPIADLAEVPRQIQRIGPLLQTVGIATAPDRQAILAGAMGQLGASRVAPVGSMAWPPAHWHHDGRPPLGELVRWCDLE